MPELFRAKKHMKTSVPQLTVLTETSYFTKEASDRFVDHMLTMGHACKRVEDGGKYKVTVIGVA